MGKKRVKTMRIMGYRKKELDREISFMEVKALYDAAFAEKEKAKVNLVRFKHLMRKATEMDKAYRLQLQDNPAFSHICHTEFKAA